MYRENITRYLNNVIINSKFDNRLTNQFFYNENLEKNEKIKEAVETMMTLTEDERVRIECMRQEKAERDWSNAMNYATEQGEERGEARGMKMGIQKGMKQERENTLKLVAKMSQNGDTEYIARLLEPEVFEQMAAKYGMKA